MNQQTVKQKLPTFERELTRRYSHTRQLLVEMRDGQREWDIDMDLAVGDLQSVLNAMLPETPEDED